MWVAALDLSEAVLAQIAGVLAPDERERAARFHFEADRRRFIAGRGILRRIIGDEYLGCDPASLVFVHGPNGKPMLDGRGAGSQLELNLAHSGDLAVYAFAEGRPLGVDLERLRALPDLDGLAAMVLTPWEQAELGRIGPAEREHAFFRVWTRKEAYLKATGEGLSRAPATFEVTVGSEAPPRLRGVDDDPMRARDWALQDLELPPGYVGALVVQSAAPTRPAPTLRVLRWGGSGLTASPATDRSS